MTSLASPSNRMPEALSDLERVFQKADPARLPARLLRAYCAWRFGWNRARAGVRRVLHEHG